VHVYAHFVWATWDRAPLITPDLEQPLHDCIAEECRQMRCYPAEVGGTQDHVHCLVRLRSSVSVAEAAKQMKGSSSHLATHCLRDGGFKWQGTYGASSVGLSEIDRVRSYIKQQKEHHRTGRLVADWERCDELDD
jgi:REP element-mobilizing transposase RayT